MRRRPRQKENTRPLPETALLERHGLTLDTGQVWALREYAGLVARWNGVAGLVARGDLGRFFTRHVLDSLILAAPIRELEGIDGPWGQAVAPVAAASPPIADFGSGAGLPGVPLAVALPRLTFMLVDRSARKVRFLRRVRDELGLRNLTVLCADVKELSTVGCRGVVARAVMPVRALWHSARAALRPGGYMLVLDRMMRSESAPGEETPAGFEGGRARRRWVAMPELGTWHGVLEVREMGS